MMVSDTTVEQIVAATEDYDDAFLLLVASFDGVLVDYQADALSVGLPDVLRDTAMRFAGGRDAALAVVSGRRLVDLRNRAGVGEGVFYIGLHGLEIEGPDFSVSRHAALSRYREGMHDLVAALELGLASVAGVRVEDKDVAIALHTRAAGPGDAVWARLHLLSTAANAIPRNEFRIIRGNHVLELLPDDLPAPRATAIAEVRRHLEARERKPVFTLYIGEDVPDDDALDAIEGPGLAAAVGGRAPKAQYHLRSPLEVWQLVERLAASRFRG
jgi:trehalose 6-phosphate phosphatase